MPTSPRRMARQQPRRASSGRAVKLAVIWLGITLVGAGFAAAGYAALHRPPDPMAFCERGGPVDAAAVVLVDTTDLFTAIQRRRMKATIEAERDRLPKGGKLTVLILNAAKPEEPKELVSACNPGSAADANPIVETASRRAARWNSGFGEPVEAAIRRAEEGTSSRNSPILASIAGVLTRPDFDARTPHRRLVVVSDMLEHDAGVYSQLKGGDFRRTYTKSDLSRRIALDLRGVAILIDYLARPRFAAVQGERHRRFWRDLFADAGAPSVTFIGLSPKGDAPTARALAPPPSAVRGHHAVQPGPRRAHPRKSRRHP